MSPLRPYKLLFPGGPASLDQVRQEFEALRLWVNGFYVAYSGVQGGDTTINITGSDAGGAPMNGVAGLPKGTIVRLAGANYVAAASRALEVDKGPLGFVADVLGAGLYFVKFGGMGAVRVTGSLGSIPDRLILSGTAGVLETAGNMSTVPTGQYVWILGTAFEAASNGLVDANMVFPPAPFMRAS